MILGYDWQVLINLAGALVLPALFFIWRQVAMVRANDLRHIQDAIDRVEKKLDTHLEWHLTASRH